MAAAIAEHEALYETLKEDYINEGCLESWGEFPTSTTTVPFVDSLDLKGGKICTCGMIYDLAASALLEEEDESASSSSSSNVAAGAIEFKAPVGIDFALVERSTTQTQMTKLESWVMACTPNSQAECRDGFAAGYPCKKVDLIAHLPLCSLATSNSEGPPKSGNDVWGWTSNDGKSREFIIWGVKEGHYFIEVADSVLVVLGFLPSSSTGSYAIQHDMKVLGDFAYMGSEGSNHGIQIFDMRRLLRVDPKRDCANNLYCQVLSADRVYTGNSNFRVGNTHNIVANEDSDYLYLVGGNNGCNGGLHIVDVIDPSNPSFVTCFGDDGYVHDAHCVEYKGPDMAYKNKSEICFCFNEDTVTIVDVTNKGDIQILSKIRYSNEEYTHQGWLSSDHRHIVFGDEVEEYNLRVKETRTLVANVENLREPTNVREYFGTSPSIDHNQYIVEATAEGQNYDRTKHSGTDLIYQANYRAGLRILQVIDYETADFREVGYFDTYPLNNSPRFNGAWSTFPFFRSGLIVISSIEDGLFLVKPDLKTSLVKDCSDDKSFRFKDTERKDCTWVKNARNGNKKAIRKRCNLMWDGTEIFSYCRETCGMVGLGSCKRKFRRKQRSDAAASETKIIPL